MRGRTDAGRNEQPVKLMKLSLRFGDGNEFQFKSLVELGNATFESKSDFAKFDLLIYRGFTESNDFGYESVLLL